jgi:hypothetical protein
MGILLCSHGGHSVVRWKRTNLYLLPILMSCFKSAGSKKNSKVKKLIAVLGATGNPGGQLV